MSVAADVQRAGHAGLLAVFGDGLGDGDDMGLVERGLQRRSAVAGGAEGDTLFRNVGVGDDVIVLADDLVDIDQICWGSGHSRIVCNHSHYSATLLRQMCVIVPIMRDEYVVCLVHVRMCVHEFSKMADSALSRVAQCQTMVYSSMLFD